MGIDNGMRNDSTEYGTHEDAKRPVERLVITPFGYGVTMTDKDTRSLKVLTDWNSREYSNEGQKAASLQVLINEALEEQDRLTRIACAEAVLKHHGASAANACINAKAL